MPLTTSDVGRARLIIESLTGEDDLSQLVQRHEQMTGGKISFNRSYEVRALDNYVIDGINVMKLPYYSTTFEAGLLMRLAASHTIKEIKKESMNYYGPIVGPVFLKYNKKAIECCNADTPCYEEMYVRGAIRKPEYLERYKKIHATYCHAIDARRTYRHDPTFKKTIAKCVKEIQDLNQDSSLKKRPNALHDLHSESTCSSDPK